MKFIFSEQPIAYPRSLKSVTAAALLLAFFVIMLGAWTRLTDAGLGCPDWPGCYGHLDVRDAIKHVKAFNAQSASTKGEVLRESFKTIPEMVHRYAAGTLGLLILAITIMVWWQNLSIKKHATALLLIVIGQAALGALTVTEGLHPTIVMLHLLGGFLTFSLLGLLLARITTSNWIPHVSLSKLAKRLLIASICVLSLQIALGGWTSANYAALVCTDLPICQSEWQHKLSFSEAFTFWNMQDKLVDKTDFEFGVLPYAERVTIHISHRFGAIVTFCLLLRTLITIFKQQKQSAYRNTTRIAIALLFAQVGLGIANIWYTLPLTVAVAHNNVAALLLATLCLLTYFALRRE